MEGYAEMMDLYTADRSLVDNANGMAVNTFGGMACRGIALMLGANDAMCKGLA